MPSRSRRFWSATACSTRPAAPVARRAAGFTLLEVLVALAILGLGVGVIFEGLGSALRLRAEANENVHLAVAAERLLGGLPTRKAAPTETEEGEAEGCRWRLEPLAPPPTPLGDVVGAGGDLRGSPLVEVRLSIAAPSGRVWELMTLLPLATPEATP